MFYLIWVPAEIFFYFLVAYFGQKSNKTKRKIFILITFILAIFPLWALIVTGIPADSKQLAFDGLLYDIIMLLTMTITLIYLGEAKNLKKYNWLGLVLIILGFIMMKL